MKYSYFLPLALLVATVTGCASVPMASKDQDVAAKSFTAQTGKAALYIYRNEIFGAAIPITMSVNNLTIGQTAPKTYFKFNVKPGTYQIKAHAENLAELGFNVEAGNSYFIWQEMKMGFLTPRANLALMDETTGRAGVLESSLIASSVSENDLDATINQASTSSSMPTGDLTAANKLRELQLLKSDGIINEQEFQEKKNQLLNKL